MKRVVRRIRPKEASSVIELMIAVTLVAILTLIVVPLCYANTTSAIMAEGIAGAVTIGNAMRIYQAQNGSYIGAVLPNSNTAGTLQIGQGDLDGKYFAQSDYSLFNVTDSTYTIQAGPPSLTIRAGMPYYTIDQNGSEQGTYYSNQ